MALLAISAKMSAIFFSLLSIIFGGLVIKFPKLIGWLIGIYFIFTGIISLLLVL